MVDITQRSIATPNTKICSRWVIARYSVTQPSFLAQLTHITLVSGRSDVSAMSVVWLSGSALVSIIELAHLVLGKASRVVVA